MPPSGRATSRCGWPVLVEDTGGRSREEIDPELARVSGMGLSDLDLFIEMLMALRGSYHRRYITEFLDSVFKRRRRRHDAPVEEQRAAFRLWAAACWRCCFR